MAVAALLGARARARGHGGDVTLAERIGGRVVAFDRWLDSQWTSAPPGLRAIKRQAATQTDPRRIQAVVPQRNGGLDQMLFPPDPRYWQHIIRI